MIDKNTAADGNDIIFKEISAVPVKHGKIDQYHKKIDNKPDHSQKYCPFGKEYK